jgi:hypothetical protein
MKNKTPKLQKVYSSTTVKWVARHRTLVLILLIDIILLLPLLMGRGEILFRDFHFPLTGDGYRHSHFPLYNETIENNNLSSWYRLPSRAPLLLLSFILPVSLVLRIYLFATILLGQVCFYVFAKRTLGIRSELMAGGLTFFYTFNHRFLDFLWETSLVHTYALLPLGLFLASSAIYERKLFNKYSLFFPFFFIFSFVHPYALIALYAIIIYWFLFVIKNVGLAKKLRNIILIGITAIISALFFLVPVAVTWLKSGPVDPGSVGVYQFSFKIIDHLSSSSLAEKLTLARSVIKLADYTPNDGILKIIWFYLAMLIYTVIPAIILLLLRYGKIKQRKLGEVSNTKSMAILYLSMLILSFGTIGFQGPLYRLFVTSVPSSFEWLFRSPLKIALYASAVLVILYGMLFARIEQNYKRVYSQIITAGFILVMSFIGFFTYRSYFLDGRLTPVKVPNAYYEINSMLDKLPDNHRVLYLPRYDETKTSWSGNRYISPYDMISSRKPTISYWWNDPAYQDYLYYDFYQQRHFDDVCLFLRPLNINYLVFHNDRLGDRHAFDEESLRILKNKYPDNIIYQKDNWYVFDFKCADIRFFSLKPNIKSSGSIIQDLKLTSLFNVVKEKSVDAYDSQETLLEYSHKAFLPKEGIWSGITIKEMRKDLQKYSAAKDLDILNEKLADTYVMTDPLANTQSRATQTAYGKFNRNNSLVNSLGPDQFSLKTQNSFDYPEIEYKTNIAPSISDSDRQGKLDFNIDIKNIKGLHINYQLYRDGQPIYSKQVLLNDLSKDHTSLESGVKTGHSAPIYIPSGVDAISMYIKSLGTTSYDSQIAVQHLNISLNEISTDSSKQQYEISDTNNSTIFLKILAHPNGGKVLYNGKDGQQNIEFYSEKPQLKWVKLSSPSDEPIALKFVHGQNIIMGYYLEDTTLKDNQKDYISSSGTCDLYFESHTYVKLVESHGICISTNSNDSKESSDLIDYFKNRQEFSRVSSVNTYYDYEFTNGSGAPSSKFGIALPLVGRKFVADNNLQSTTYLSSVYSLPNYEKHKFFSMPILKMSMLAIAISGIFITAYQLYGSWRLGKK